MLGPKGRICQSCGMPLSRDSMGGGTNADGARSTEYCSHCYRKGLFAEPDLTVEQMVAKVQGKLMEMHFPLFLARYFTRRIPGLGRWRTRTDATTA